MSNSCGTVSSSLIVVSIVYFYSNISTLHTNFFMCDVLTTLNLSGVEIRDNQVWGKASKGIHRRTQLTQFASNIFRLLKTGPSNLPLKFCPRRGNWTPQIAPKALPTGGPGQSSGPHWGSLHCSPVYVTKLFSLIWVTHAERSQYKFVCALFSILFGILQVLCAVAYLGFS